MRVLAQQRGPAAPLNGTCAVTTSMPSSRAAAAVSPTEATCGSVNTTWGTGTVSGSGSSASPLASARIRCPITRARYLPQCVSGASPLASPTACSHDGSGRAVVPSARGCAAAVMSCPLSPISSRPRSSSRGRRPVAASTSSTTISRVPLASWTCSVTAPPWTRPRPVSRASSRSAETTLMLSWTVTPRSCRASSTCFPANGSNPRSSASPRTSSVTSLPSAAIQVAASTATTPPPTIASRCGTSCTPVASREVQGDSCASSGGIVALDPLASTTARRARTRVAPASGSPDPASDGGVTSTSRSLASRP